MFGILKNLRNRRTARRGSSRVGSQQACEVLEDKTLLAGNVFASMNASGNLVLRGDAKGNAVTITTLGNGVQVTGGIGTRVNGLPIPKLFPGASINNVDAKLRGGDDTLVVVADTIAGNLKAKLGGGSDVVEVTASVGGDVNIHVAAAVPGTPDVVTVNASTIDGSMILKGTGGRQNFIITSSTVAGASSIKMGGGRDFLNTSATVFSSGLSADGGGGVLDTFINIGAMADHRRFEIFT